MKNFHEGDFRADIDNVTSHVSSVFDDIEDIYWAHNQMFSVVLNEHVPQNAKWIKKSPIYEIWVTEDDSTA